MPEITDKAFITMGINKWVCLPLNHSLPIQGFPNSEKSSMGFLSIYPCDNATTNNNCAQSEFISNILHRIDACDNFNTNLVDTNMPIIIKRNKLLYYKEIEDSHEIAFPNEEMSNSHIIRIENRH